MNSTEIELRTVSSRHLSQIGYDDESRTLVIVFNDGSRYHYNDVPPSVFRNLIRAQSIGKYFSLQVKPYYRGIPE